jgi:hypothetical protein
LNFLTGHAPDLQVYRAARENNQYRLKIVPFLADEIAARTAPVAKSKRRQRRQK